jgi:hypothetical protein
MALFKEINSSNNISMESSDDLNKYFDSKEYITQIIGIDKELDKPKINEDKISKLISLLTDPANKAFKEETLLTLKKEKAGDVLLLSIASPKAKINKHLLVSACWESEINFSKYLSFFIILALDNVDLVSLEAITVISTMEGPFNNDAVKDGIKKVKAAMESNPNNTRTVLLNDLIYTLEGFIEN